MRAIVEATFTPHTVTMLSAKQLFRPFIRLRVILRIFKLIVFLNLHFDKI